MKISRTTGFVGWRLALALLLGVGFAAGGTAFSGCGGASEVELLGSLQSATGDTPPPPCSNLSKELAATATVNNCPPNVPPPLFPNRPPVEQLPRRQPEL
jgi:hypothetical protein